MKAKALILTAQNMTILYFFFTGTLTLQSTTTSTLRFYYFHPQMNVYCILFYFDSFGSEKESLRCVVFSHASFRVQSKGKDSSHFTRSMLFKKLKYNNILQTIHSYLIFPNTIRDWNRLPEYRGGEIKPSFTCSDY